MLNISNLTVSFNDRRGGVAVRGINLVMQKGERLGLVGESGSGKTMLALSVAGLLRRTRIKADGQIFFEGTDLLSLSRNDLRRIQGREIAMIFQEPMTCLNPLMKIGPQVEETLRIHTNYTAPHRKQMALEVMRDVELPEPESIYEKYPHQLSGGQRQRVMIASAFISRPKLLIADEPTTALDVTVQAQILKLLLRINESSGVALLFISHDLGVVRRLCSRVAVMRNGQIVEQGAAEVLFNEPHHEYTKNLIASVPKLDSSNCKN